MGINKKTIITKNDEYTEETSTELNQGQTNRGFGLINFTDRYQQECSLQDSSLATEAAIWLGVDNTGPELTGPTGQRNEPVGARMHLTQTMVKQLLPFLTKFAQTGEYIANMKVKPTQAKQKSPKKTKKL